MTGPGPICSASAQARFWAIWNGETYQTYRRHVFTDQPYGPCKTCYLIYPNPELAGDEGYEKF